MPCPASDADRRRPLVVKRVPATEVSTGGVVLPQNVKSLRTSDALVLIVVGDESELEPGMRVMINPFSQKTVRLMPGDEDIHASVGEALLIYREDIYGYYPEHGVPEKK